MKKLYEKFRRYLFFRAMRKYATPQDLISASKIQNYLDHVFPRK